MTRLLIVIPARLASSRLPRKMLLSETGQPLILHTVAQAQKVAGARVLVATDDEEIRAAVTGADAEAVMTDPAHESGTDRVAEAAAGIDADVIVNVQGDEPEISPETIAALAETHLAAQSGERPAFASTVASPFEDTAAAESPNAVKVVLTQKDEAGVRSALYFSRSKIPFPRAAEVEPLLHIGLYAFSPKSLAAFPSLTRTPLERTESLEQLRILEHGHRIAVTEVASHAPGIDTREDYDAFVARHAAKA